MSSLAFCVPHLISFICNFSIRLRRMPQRDVLIAVKFLRSGGAWQLRKVASSLYWR